MRTFLLAIALILFSFSAFCQPNASFFYKITNSEDYTIWYQEDKNTAPVQKRIPGKYLQADLSQKGDTVFIDFLEPLTNEEEEGVVNATDSPDLFYFTIKKKENLGQPRRTVSIPFSSADLGIFTIPFKYRFGSESLKGTLANNLDTDLNVNFYFGRMWGKTTYSSNGNYNSLYGRVGPFFGLQRIKIREDTIGEGENYEMDSNELGLSTGVSIGLGYGKVSMGLALGIDFPVSGLGPTWAHANRIWLGVGLGYRLGG